MYDLDLHSTRVLTSTGVRDATIIIRNGVIQEVVEGFSDETATDARDLVIMPGVVDPHVHINEPGRTSWEGFDTATRAAIAGGITTLVDMPLNASPVTTTADAFQKKLDAAKGQLHTNCGFWGGIIPGNEYEVERLIDSGVLGFKAFLTYSGIAEFPEVAEDDLRLVMPVLARYKLPLLVHCELSSGEVRAIGDRTNYRTFLASRPKEWEDEAIAMMIRLCREYQCRVHIVHLSSANSIDQIAKAKEEGLPLTAETAQHYLFFHAEEIAAGKTGFVCAPPIRESANNEKLWQALQDGVIDFVATDHSPSPQAMKELETGDLLKCWGGISSLQFALPALWTAAKARSIHLKNMAKWLSEKPAQLAGLHHRKGKIEKGFDADLVVWDPEKKFIVTGENILHRHKLTPYMHRELFGVVEQTYLSGAKVFDDGKFLHLNKGRAILRSSVV
jgi:allantoinase